MAQKEGTNFNFEDADKVEARISKTQRIELDKAVEQYPGLYESRSHFIRCAINRELRRLKTEKPEME